jgi:energy-coupling factor transporter transmembrane protein EcfT
MNNLIKFLCFIVYATFVFFFPNNEIIVVFVLINSFVMIINFRDFKNILCRTFKIFPFVLFTFVFNCLLDDFVNACWIGAKLLIVCNITISYSNTTSVLEVADTVKLLCYPLTLFNVNTDDIKVMVCISLSMLPVLKNDLYEVKNACIAKNIKFNIFNMKYILSKFFITLLKRVNEIEESLITK